MRTSVLGSYTMRTKILLIAEEGLARAAYTETLRDLEIDVECIASPDEMNDALVDASYNGLLVDVPTMIRCESVNKSRITRIMNRFPVLRLMYNPKYGGIRGLAQGGTIKDNRDLTEFVLHECVPFLPRSIRIANRQGVVFNVKLLSDLVEESDAERTVTLNLSEHGCFIYTLNKWMVDSPAWMIINEFDDATPIEMKVRWQRPWGQVMRMPGIGTTFESMTTQQYVQLHSYL